MKLRLKPVVHVWPLRSEVCGRGCVPRGCAGPEPAATSAEQQQLERVEITGSRIMRRETESESPVSVITAQEIRMTGATNSIQVVTSCRRPRSTRTAAVRTAATNLDGEPRASLRTARWVLLNGRRMPAGDPNYFPTDLNFIPAALIQRVEVLTGGLGRLRFGWRWPGVVNFIMNEIRGLPVRLHPERLQPPAGQLRSAASWPIAQRPTRRSSRCPETSASEARSTTCSVLIGATSPTARATRRCSSATTGRMHHAVDVRTTAPARSTRPAADGPVHLRPAQHLLPGTFLQQPEFGFLHIGGRAGQPSPVASANRPVQLWPYNYSSVRTSAGRGGFHALRVHPQVRVTANSASWTTPQRAGRAERDLVKR